MGDGLVNEHSKKEASLLQAEMPRHIKRKICTNDALLCVLAYYTTEVGLLTISRFGDVDE